jgi:hypothetical protein
MELLEVMAVMVQPFQLQAHQLLMVAVAAVEFMVAVLVAQVAQVVVLTDKAPMLELQILVVGAVVMLTVLLAVQVAQELL